MTDPTFQHQRIAGMIYRRLADWSETVGSGLAGFGGNWTVGAGSSYKPDAWWVDDEQAATLVGARSDRPPELVVEVRSRGTWALDIGVKRETYEATGAAELWLVDLPAASVLVFRRSRRDARVFDVALDIGRHETLTSPLLPGFELPLVDLFR